SAPVLRRRRPRRGAAASHGRERPVADRGRARAARAGRGLGAGARRRGAASADLGRPADRVRQRHGRLRAQPGGAMTDTGAPAPGEMQLYDAVLPPLLDGTYQLHVQTTVTGGQFPLPGSDSFFSIEGPRFALPATDVSAVHPPRNAQGTFDQVLP